MNEPLFPGLPPEIDAQVRERNLTGNSYAKFACVLQVGSGGAPFAAAFASRRRVAGLTATDASVITLAGGSAAVNVRQLPDTTFAVHERIRNALTKVGWQPGMQLAVDLRPDCGSAREKAEIAYCALSAAASLPRIGKDKSNRRQIPVRICGLRDGSLTDIIRARARANHLARWLAALPGNLLTPARLIELATSAGQQHGLESKLLSIADLIKIGAGAFTAVTGREGSGGLLRLTWQPARKRPLAKIALVGKGVTFDTGGVNVKPHRHMLTMHADMAGAAACLAATCAAARLNLPLHIDCWLAVADNRIFRQAYAPADVVQAADKTTIEIVHSDAEGRMLLADALCLAARRRPGTIVSMATLTGSIISALGTRMSGVLANNERVLASALAAGNNCGERLVAFPIAQDYEAALESKIADIRQCPVSGDADHIAAALLLKRFVGKRNWLHVDLAASHHQGGLGAIADSHTGFGASWAVQWLADLAKAAR